MRPDEVRIGMNVFIIDIDEQNRVGPLHALEGKIIETGKGIALVRIGQQTGKYRSSETGDGLIATPVKCLTRTGVAPVEVFG